MTVISNEIESSHPVIILPCDDGLVAHIVCYEDCWVGTIMSASWLIQVFSLDAARTVTSYFRGDIPRHYLEEESISISTIHLSIDKSGQISKEWKTCQDELPEELHHPSEQVTKWMSLQEIAKI